MRLNNRRGLLTLWIALILALLLSSCSRDPLNDTIQKHENLALHTHTELHIEILGKNETIPQNIGISNKGMRFIHTHDSSGELHLEPLYPHQFFLKDAFFIWTKNFNNSCIFEYCSNSTHVMNVYVNGVKSIDPENLPLEDHDIVKIVYEKRK